MGVRACLIGAMAVGLVWACVPSGSGGGRKGNSNRGAGGQAMGAGGAVVPPGAIGSACAGSDDCDSGVCSELGGVRFCTQICGDDAPCPEGASCQLGFCVPDMGAGAGGALGNGGAAAMGGSSGEGGTVDQPSQGGQLGQGGANRPELCGETDPVLQCRVACGRLAQCWAQGCEASEFAPRLEMDCGNACPNPPLTNLICIEELICEAALAALWANQPELEQICSGQGGGDPPDPCNNINCGPNGNCANGECVCMNGFSGDRCQEPPEDPTAACRAFMRCIEPCGDRADCIDDCSGDHPVGGFLYGSLIQCMTDNQCFNRQGEIDSECVNRFCGDEAAACFPPAAQPQGVMSCMAINICLDNCEDAACQNRCIANGAENSVRLLERFRECASESGCADFDCVEAVCAESYLACRRDSSGNSSCEDIFDCTTLNCRQDDDACLQNCYFDGSVAAQNTFLDVITCMNAEGCREPAMCPACDAFIRACLGNRGG